MFGCRLVKVGLFGEATETSVSELELSINVAITHRLVFHQKTPSQGNVRFCCACVLRREMVWTMSNEDMFAVSGFTSFDYCCIRTVLDINLPGLSQRNTSAAKQFTEPARWRGCSLGRMAMLHLPA